MTKITIGSTIIGKSGKKLIVDRVEGDIIYSGEFRINISAVVSVEPLSIIDRLAPLASLSKREAIERLSTIALDFSVNSIYEASLDLDTYSGIFIRGLLENSSSLEFAEVGRDGSQGKYGEWVSPDSPPPINQTGSEIGSRVTHLDLYHCYGADVGTIELIDSGGDYHVRWDSDNHVGRYGTDSLNLMRF